jgi:hypothetical protein
MRHYQRELEDDEHALEENSLDDDYDDNYDQSKDPVPWDWQNYDSSQCNVNRDQNVPWEYTKNEVIVGTMYPSTAHVKDAIEQWSIFPLHMEFRVVKSSPSIYDVHCKKEDCAF